MDRAAAPPGERMACTARQSNDRAKRPHGIMPCSARSQARERHAVARPADHPPGRRPSVERGAGAAEAARETDVPLPMAFAWPAFRYRGLSFSPKSWPSADRRKVPTPAAPHLVGEGIGRQGGYVPLFPQRASEGISPASMRLFLFATKRGIRAGAVPRRPAPPPPTPRKRAPLSSHLPAPRRGS